MRVSQRARQIAVRLGALALCLTFAGPLFAQSPRDELLALVPGDSGFCFVVNQFRGQLDKWQASPWVKGLRTSIVGQAFLSAPETQQLFRLQEVLKRRLDVDWPSLRDDVLGDAIVFAYRPPLPGNPEHEQGLLLVRARKPEVLTRLLDKLNVEQKKSGELKDLVQLEHRGVKYHKRTDARSTHYVLQDGPLFALSAKEKVLRDLIEQRQDKNAEMNTIAQQFQRGGADRALFAVWINPRAFETELEQRAQKNSGPEGLMLRTFLAYWRPLDNIVLSLTDGDDIEFKLSVQARPKELPPSVRKAFVEPGRPSELWNRFPTQAIFTLADRLDVALLSESLAEFSTPKNNKLAVETLQKTVGAALGLDLVRDVLPNLGPDWGFCVVAAEQPTHFPHLLAALAVKPGTGDVPVDQALFKGVQFFASLAVFDHNRKNAQQLRLKATMQDKVEVRYLDGDKVFPPGMQPAFALKDGYLLFASSPEAIQRFQPQSAPAVAGRDVPIVRLSTTELTRLLRDRRKHVVDHLAEKNQVTSAVANQSLEAMLGLLDLVDHVTLLQSSGAGQLAWTVRVRGKTP